MHNNPELQQSPKQIHAAIYAAWYKSNKTNNLPFLDQTICNYFPMCIRGTLE